MKTKFLYNFIFSIILIGLAVLVCFLMIEENKLSVSDKPVLNNVIVFESSDKMKIRQYLNIFQRQKNKIEKAFEKKIVSHAI